MFFKVLKNESCELFQNKDEIWKKLHEIYKWGKNNLLDHFKESLFLIKQEILILGIYMNIIDFEVFFEFLTDPLNNSKYLISKKLRVSEKFREHNFPIYIKFLPEIYTINQIIELYLPKYLLSNHCKIKELKNLFEENYFKKMKYKI